MRRHEAIIFGEALVDAFADGLVAGGAPFNVACHLAALGFDPWLVSRIGEDEAGAVLRATAARCGLRLDGVQRDTCTARVLVHEDGGGHRFEIPPAQAFDRIEPEAARAVRLAVRDPLPWLYFGTLALRAPTSRAALAALRAAGPHRAFVDLNWREAGPPPDVIVAALDSLAVLKLSDEELARLLGWLGLPATDGRALPGRSEAALRALAERTGAATLLVSHGAGGASAWDGTGRAIAHAPAPALPALVDTVGAGDAFSAMMLAGLLEERPLAEALERAVAFAGTSCTWRGALPADLSVYQPWRSTGAAP